MATLVDQLFSVEVGDDKMHAFIKCCKLGVYSDVTPGQVVAALEAETIEVSDQTTQRILEFAERIKAEGPSQELFEIATGTLPRNGVDARLEWDQRYQADRPAQWAVQGRPDFYDVRSLVNVQEGEVIGKLIRRDDGEEGLDVFGNAIPRERVAKDLVPGDGVVLGEDFESLLAQRNGKVEIVDGMITISECCLVEENVGPSAEKTISPNALHIVGAIRGAVVECDRSIVVEQGIESAELHAGGDVITAEGIEGRNRGTITAAGNIVARFCESATLEAGGDVRILTSLNNTELRAEGGVDISGGVIVGGTIYAREGVIAKTVGNYIGVKTILRVGVHPDVLAKIAEKDGEIRAKEQAASRIRETVGPLMSQMKRLTAAQREKATELLAAADDLSDEIGQLKADQHPMSPPTRPASVQVESKLYPGTLLFFDDLECQIDKEIRGPVLIQLSEVKGEPVVVITNTFSKTNKVLPSKKSSPSTSKAR